MALIPISASIRLDRLLEKGLAVGTLERQFTALEAFQYRILVRAGELRECLAAELRGARTIKRRQRDAIFLRRSGLELRARVFGAFLVFA